VLSGSRSAVLVEFGFGYRLFVSEFWKQPESKALRRDFPAAKI